MAWRYIGSTLQFESTERCIAPIVSCLLISTHHAALTFLYALLLTCVNIKPSFTVLSNYFILSHVRAFYVLKLLLMAFKNDQIIIHMINVKKIDGSWDWQPFSACFFLFLFTLHNAWLNAEILLNQLMVQNQKKCCSCTVNEAKPVKKNCVDSSWWKEWKSLASMRTTYSERPRRKPLTKISFQIGKQAFRWSIVAKGSLDNVTAYWGIVDMSVVAG